MRLQRLDSLLPIELFLPAQRVRDLYMHLVTKLMLTIFVGCVLIGCTGKHGPAKKIELEKVMTNKEAGVAFLEKNASEPGVVQTESGLQYKVVESGSGKTPTMSDTVAAHYSGRLLDGTKFDSSYDRGEPLTIPVGGVIKGWTEALLMMKEGDKWVLYIPPELAYGSAGVGPIPGDSALIFDIELVEVK